MVPPRRPSCGAAPSSSSSSAPGSGSTRRSSTWASKTGPGSSPSARPVVGLPGYDQFRTSPDAFWQAGIKLEWRPWTWRSAGRTADTYRLQQQIVATEEQALGRQLARNVVIDLEDIGRLKAALADDERIVTLRTEVERQARAQYDEGAITTPDYVEARTDVLEARLALERHRVELAQARSRYLTTLGLTSTTASDTP